jgi:hypothetical protein
MDPERRRSPRASVDGDGSNGVLRGAVPVAVRDISSGGLRLSLGSSLEPGGVYPLTVLLRGLSLAPVAGSPGERNPAWEAGGQFLWRDESDAAAVRRWLERRAAGAS